MSAIGMPPHLLVLFQPRPPIEYMKAVKKKKLGPYGGIADLIHLFEDSPPPPKEKVELPKERKERIKQEKIMEHEKHLKELISKYNPHAGVTHSGKPFGDAFKTLFVARINYETTEKKLKREFEEYGPIKRVRMIYDRNGKPRGYAFIEYESDRNMKEAYKQADGRKIDGKRVLVDVERGRTVPGWLPRRLGGGRGPARGSGNKAKNTSITNTLLNNLSNSNTNNIHSSSIKNQEKDSLNNNSYSSKNRDKDRDRDRPRDRDRDRERHKKRKSRSRDRERKRSRDRERKRDRSRDKDRDRDRDRRRDREER